MTLSFSKMQTYLLKIIVFILILGRQSFCINITQAQTGRTKRSNFSYYKSEKYYSNDNAFEPPHCQTGPACLNPNEVETLTVEAISWLFKPKILYITMGTCWGYSLVASVLLGREVYSLRELQEMCLSQIYISSENLLITNGYGVQYQQKCNFNENNVALCNNTGGDPTTDSFLQVGEADYPVATDGHSWVPFYRCVDNRQADFQLFSSRPFIRKRVLANVIDKITQLGFNRNDVMLLPCYSATYLVPFQNYPVPDAQLSNFALCHKVDNSENSDDNPYPHYQQFKV